MPPEDPPSRRLNQKNGQRKKRRKWRWRIRRRTPPGSSPGTLVVDPAAPSPVVWMISFGPNAVEEGEVDERDLRELSRISHSLQHHPVTWINIDGLGDAQTLQRVADLFGLHRLALEDIVNTHQRAKVEAYGEELFLVARMVSYSGRIATEQLSMFLGRNFVLTFQEAPGDCLEPVRQRIRNAIGKIRSSGADYLAYAILDAVIDNYYPVLEQYSEQLDQLEDQVLSGANGRTIDRIHELKRDLLQLRRAIWPHREAMAALTREEFPTISESTRVYLRDCYDHVVQIVDLVTIYRELVADLRELYMSMLSHRTNDTMRVLTIIATIFMPLTFIAGIYGMNFKYMPELEWVLGYPMALALMGLTSAGMIYFFYRRGWLG